MTFSKKYFHDHLVLLLLSINIFLVIASTIFILIRISTSHGSSFIVQYRPTVGINIFTTGNIVGLISFIAFGWLVSIANFVLSLRFYPIHRQVAIAVLSLGILLLVLSVIISNSLLYFR